MIKQELKEEFEKFLIKENMFSQVVSNILTYHKFSFDEYLNEFLPHNWIYRLNWTSSNYRELNTRWRDKLAEFGALE